MNSKAKHSNNPPIDPQKVALVNLGCPRNLVDSQVILGKLSAKGHVLVDVQDSDVAIVNTCGFIEDAKKESIDTIIDLIELKKNNKIKKIIIAGCLAQRYRKELLAEFPEIDALIGIQQLKKQEVSPQIQLTPKHFAYLKICESCYNQCSFCIIPKIKGKFTSRTMESIIEEVKYLDSSYVKELNIIGQDITAYGMDVYKGKMLSKLLQEIVAVIKNIEWIRLSYLYPSHITDELLGVISREKKICNYIDVPLQHINDRILKSMNRNMTTEQTKALIDKIRTKIPDAAIRTSFIVGFPQETDAEFQELVEFVKDTKFDKMGVFVYSNEEGTKSFSMDHQVSSEIKEKRYHQLMSLQKDISSESLRKCIDKNLKILIDEKKQDEDNVYIGRTQYDAYDIDGEVYLHADNTLNVGDFVQAKIIDSYEYDLVGEL